MNGFYNSDLSGSNDRTNACFKPVVILDLSVIIYQENAGHKGVCSKGLGRYDR